MRDFIPVLLLHLIEDTGEGHAVRTGGEHEFDDDRLAAIIVQVVELHLAVEQGEARARAGPGPLRTAP